jgi:hypothetical protein
MLNCGTADGGTERATECPDGRRVCGRGC